MTLALGNGFILTAMLWGGFLAELIDRRLRRSALDLGILALLTYFGVIHSVSPDGNMHLPWTLAGVQRSLVSQFTTAYAVLAILLLLLSLTRRDEAPGAAAHGGPA